MINSRQGILYQLYPDYIIGSGYFKQLNRFKWMLSTNIAIYQSNLQAHRINLQHLRLGGSGREDYGNRVSGVQMLSHMQVNTIATPRDDEMC